MRFFPLIDAALLAQESRSAYASRTPRVWPSEASAELFDKRESNIVGKCHRQSYFRLIGQPASNTIDVVGARRFRTGRAMELDIIGLAQDAGIFVASGVRYHVEDIDLPLELDLVVLDPDTGQLCIVENKTIYGYSGGAKVIKQGNPKLEGVMQSVIYLNEFSTGAILKHVIYTSFDNKRKAAARIVEIKTLLKALRAAPLESERQIEDLEAELRRVQNTVDRNRIEVDWNNFKKASDEPVGVKLTYETRDDCQTREFDIGLSEDPLDGLHYPSIDEVPQRVFTVESIYERYRTLQAYYTRNVGIARKKLSDRGVEKPGPDAAGTTSNTYWDLVFESVRALPPSYWPPAEYQWRYSSSKIQLLGEAGILGKTKYKDWQKQAKGKTFIGAWNCQYCPHKAKCVAVEYPDLSHMVADLVAIDEEAA